MSQQMPPPIPPSPVGPPGSTESPSASTGLVLGIVGIVLSFACPLAGFVCGAVGFTKSKAIKELCARDPSLHAEAGTAQAGYVCSLLALIFSAVAFVLGCVWGFMRVLLEMADV